MDIRGDLGIKNHKIFIFLYGRQGCPSKFLEKGDEIKMVAVCAMLLFAYIWGDLRVGIWLTAGILLTQLIIKSVRKDDQRIIRMMREEDDD